MSSPRGFESPIEFPLDAPKGANGLDVIFAPTRTQITHALLAGPGLEGIEPSHGEPALASFSWSEGLPRRTRLRLSVFFQGEGPQLFFSRWGKQRSSDADIASAPPPIDEVKQSVFESLYDKRAALAQTNPNHAFFFELDRQTLDAFVQLDTSVSAAHRVYRQKGFGCLSRLMMDRLWTRHAGALPNEAAPQDVDLIEYFSTIFWNASDRLFDGLPQPSLSERVARVGAALEEFASGQLQYFIKFADPSLKDVFVSDPDSFYVFFFSEFASLAIGQSQKDVHVKPWSLLRAATISMQRYYVKRMLESSGAKTVPALTAVTGAKYPVPALSAQGILDLQAEAVAGSLDEQVHKNLKDLGTKFGDVPPLDPYCSTLALPIP